MCREVQELHGRIAEVPTAIPQPVPEEATNQKILVVISTPTCLSFRPLRLCSGQALREISPFLSRLGWCSNPPKEIVPSTRNDRGGLIAHPLALTRSISRGDLLFCGHSEPPTLSFRPLREISFPPHEPQPSRASQEISPSTRNDRGEPLIAHLE